MVLTPRSRAPGIEGFALVIESEFKEMPGMRLTFEQVRRLWNLSTDDAVHMMNHLVAAGRLAQDESGRYCLCGEQFV